MMIAAAALGTFVSFVGAALATKTIAEADAVKAAAKA
ncbi:hypothetical protein GGR19_000154 [Croceicoccus naphthovorans]|nr:hypothetical protein [Croceicoccus naphthovorans]